jgi:hypothetical protein
MLQQEKAVIALVRVPDHTELDRSRAAVRRSIWLTDAGIDFPRRGPCSTSTG